MKHGDIAQYNIPNVPGVYTFVNSSGERIYIGKATSLHSRVQSYFGKNLMHARGPLLVKMLDEAVSVEWQETDSVLEALILEANLIKRHQPKYNSKEKSNKSFNYLVITDEAYPRVLIKRGRELLSASMIGGVGDLHNIGEYNHVQAMPALRRSRQLSSDLGGLTEQAQETSTKPKSCGWPSHDVSTNVNTKYNTSYSHIFGPFPYGSALKQALKIVRKIFPYRDKCSVSAPATEQGKAKTAKPCFAYQIGLCPGVCVGAVTSSEYKRTIRHIVLLFEGKKKKLIKSLGIQMRKLAKAERFEEAARVRNQIYALEHINDVALSGNNDSIKMHETLQRIEAYDIAHMSEQNRVGVMVVLEHGEPSKSEYKKFKIKTDEQGDIAGLKELLIRRLRHKDDWKLPSLIVVDGGKAQINAVRAILQKAQIQIPVVGVVKDKRHKPKAIVGDKALSSIHESEILLANSEAHRFAIGYHKHIRNKNMLE